MIGRLLPRLHTADNGGDVVHFEHPLTEQPAVDLFEIVVRFTRPLCRSEQHARDTLQILQSHRRRANRIRIANGYLTIVPHGRKSDGTFVALGEVPNYLVLLKILEESPGPKPTLKK